MTKKIPQDVRRFEHDPEAIIEQANSGDVIQAQAILWYAKKCHTLGHNICDPVTRYLVSVTLEIIPIVEDLERENLKKTKKISKEDIRKALRKAFRLNRKRGQRKHVPGLSSDEQMEVGEEMYQELRRLQGTKELKKGDTPYDLAAEKVSERFADFGSNDVGPDTIKRCYKKYLDLRVQKKDEPQLQGLEWFKKLKHHPPE